MSNYLLDQIDEVIWQCLKEGVSRQLLEMAIFDRYIDLEAEQENNDK